MPKCPICSRLRSKLICAINVIQSPTDHYELPSIAKRAIQNIQITPKYISADTIYLNQISLSCLVDKKIEGLIPTRNQSKEKIGKLNPNPYHKDPFECDYKLNAFKCPENNYMHFFGKYIEHTKIQKKPDKIKRIYNNYDACKNCKARNKCCTSSQTHRTITEYGSEMQKAMNQKMKKQEYKDEYAKRSSIEGPFGILKEKFDIEKSSHRNNQNRRKTQPRCTSIQSNKIIQHNRRNRKYKRWFRKFLQTKISNTSIKPRCNQVLE